MAEIQLYNGAMCLIDDADLDRISAFSWGIEGKGYACRHGMVNGKSRRIYMHRVLVDAPPRQRVDHKNGNRLDNRSENLRFATALENSRNRSKGLGTTSKYKGVTWHKQCRKWQASIGIGGRPNYLGIFASELMAAKAYNEAATTHYGEFARINNLDEE